MASRSPDGSIYNQIWSDEPHIWPDLRWLHPLYHKGFYTSTWIDYIMRLPFSWNPIVYIQLWFHYYIANVDNTVHRSPNKAVAMRLLYSNLYFGGVPSKVDPSLAQLMFYGCIGHATLNGVIVNFANLTDISQATIGNCLYKEPTKPLYSVPPNREFAFYQFISFVLMKCWLRPELTLKNLSILKGFSKRNIQGVLVLSTK